MAKQLIKQRNRALDLLRTLSVVVAIWIHANKYLSLPGNFYTTTYLRRVAQVGYVFAFAGGYISASGYLNKFKHSFAQMSRKMITKGIVLLIVIIVYVLLMSLVMASDVTGIWQVVFFHPFQNQVLFIFALMYMTLPFIYWVLIKTNKTIALVITASLLLWIGDRFMGDPSSTSKWFIVLFDHRNNIYPLTYMLSAHLMGLWWGRCGLMLKGVKIAPFWRLLGMGGLFVLIVVNRTALNHATHSAFSWQIVIGGLTMAAMVYMLEAVLEMMPNLKGISWITMPGRESLVFYMAGNAMVDILNLSRDMSFKARILIMLLIMGVAYCSSALWSVSRSRRMRLATEKNRS